MVYIYIVFVIQCIWCFRNFWGSANILLQIAFKMGRKWRRFWVQHILWSSKILCYFWIEAYNFFSNGHIRKVISTLPNVVQMDPSRHKDVVTTLLRCHYPTLLWCRHIVAMETLGDIAKTTSLQHLMKRRHNDDFTATIWQLQNDVR